MTNEQALSTAPQQETSLIKRIAGKYHVDANKMLDTLKATAFRLHDNRVVTNEQMMALLVVADQYNLNPFTKQIYAFESNGGIQPIVPVDGWAAIINGNKQFDGMEFVDTFDDHGNILSITCKMYRKDRSHPIEVTEYLRECKRNTEPWQKWPVRMLRHKAMIQAARYAFALSGIYDEDEAGRISEAETAGVVTAEIVDVPRETNDAPQLPIMDDNFFKQELDNSWRPIITSGKKDAPSIIGMLKTRYTLTENQELEILALEDIIDADD